MRCLILPGSCEVSRRDKPLVRACFAMPERALHIFGISLLVKVAADHVAEFVDGGLGDIGHFVNLAGVEDEDAVAEGDQLFQVG